MGVRLKVSSIETHAFDRMSALREVPLEVKEGHIITIVVRGDPAVFSWSRQRPPCHARA